MSPIGNIIPRFQRSSGREAAEPPPDLTPAQIDELSRALKIMAEMQDPAAVMSTVQDRSVSLIQSFVAEEGGRPLLEAPGNAREARFDEHDIHWYEFWKYAGKFQRYPWVENLVSPTELPDPARVALFGDWGTALYGAEPISTKIASAKPGYEVVFHLGDTYYSGTSKEIAERLLKDWPNVPNAINRSLNGNHEMYSGGEGYFRQVVLGFGQSASYFALQNKHWLLAGLDTSYNEHDLHGDQADWLQKLVDQSGDRKLVLFSHHQPFTLFPSSNPLERGNGMVLDKLAKLLKERRITAWYWGHEHRCLLYEPHDSWGFHGRCVGHGGFPEFRKSKDFDWEPPPQPTFKKIFGRLFVPNARVLDGPNECIPGHEKEYLPHGYMTLRFDGPELFETVHDAISDKPLWHQPLIGGM